MRKIKLNILWLVITLAAVLPLTIYAQYGSSGIADARSSGMGKTYNAISDGVYSIGINPANLFEVPNRSIQFKTILPLPSVGLRTGTDFMTLNDLNYYFGGQNGSARYLTESDKQRLNGLFKGGGLIFASASVNLINISYKVNSKIGVFGFSVTDFISTKLNFPQALVNLALNGNQIGNVYNLSNADIKAWWIRDYSLSYARSLDNLKPTFFKELMAGISVKLVHGFMYMGTEKINSYLSTGSFAQITGKSDLLGYSAFSDNFGVKYNFDSTKHNSNFSLFPSPAGVGYGLDFGLLAELNNNLKLSMAVTDLGAINWNKNAAEFSSFGKIYLDDISSQAERDSLKNQITGSSKKIGSFSTGLATALRFGAAYTFDYNKQNKSSLTLALDYNQGLNNLPGNTTNPRISVGSEWKPVSWSPFLRTGFSFGGLTGFQWAFGLGVDLGLIEINVASSDFQTVFAPNNSKEVSISFDSRWEID